MSVEQPFFKKTDKTLVFHSFNYSLHNIAASCWDREM